MSILDHPRYRLNMILLKVLGIWPFQSKIASRLSGVLYPAFYILQIIPEIHRVYLEPTQDNFKQFFPPVMISSYACTMMINSNLQINKTKKLLLMIERDWIGLKEGPVFDIMTNAADNGRKLSLCYAIACFNTSILILVMPMRPKLWVWLGWQDGPAEFVFQYPLDYWVDSYTYLYAIELHIIICTFVLVAAIVAIESMFLVFVIHACSLFSSICYRLENLIEDSDLNIQLYPRKIDDHIFAVISDCIEKHNRAIEFVNLVDDAYTYAILFGMGLHIVNMTISGIQLITHLDDVDEIIRYGSFILIQIVYLFIESLISQQVIDYSEQVDNAIFMCKWYAISMRSRKLLHLMSMRSRSVCRITAGKFFVMSLEFFTTYMKTAASYFTLLRSVVDD